MKFTLDESLFDDEMINESINMFPEKYFAEYGIDYDDDLFEYEPIAKAEALTEHNGEAVLEGPNPGIESGIADALIGLINDEWEAIQGYNNFRDMILSMQQHGDGDYSEMLAVIDDVVNEENRHVGQLQELLKLVSPNAKATVEGELEARAQLNPSTPSGNEWVNGKLKVEMHQPLVAAESNNSVNPNAVDTNCVLCDVDDEW